MSGAAARTGRQELIRNKKILINRRQESGWEPLKSKRGVHKIREHIIVPQKIGKNFVDNLLKSRNRSRYGLSGAAARTGKDIKQETKNK